MKEPILIEDKIGLAILKGSWFLTKNLCKGVIWGAKATGKAASGTASAVNTSIVTASHYVRNRAEIKAIKGAQEMARNNAHLEEKKELTEGILQIIELIESGEKEKADKLLTLLEVKHDSWEINELLKRLYRKR